MVTGMSLRVRMRRALPEAMRARDTVAVSALRATLTALDNAEAVPVDEAELNGLVIEQSPVGAGAAEAVRRELSERDVADIVRADATERLEAAAQLTALAHGDRAPGFARRPPCCFGSSTARHRVGLGDGPY